ncbi:hypothetical protein PQ465_09640 [Sphingobacterium oryzagri]|uniref:Sel1 repeat family protein n=1 Tax=Sphingobacterium oryzagri TaxID=3025669 RepID=A0ABY7WTI0_9SPHI|nr:hypothetical protein [Sphingobacterium sp. KACC 22765]WDF70619.1 hypothetical protein PQ465_09640 [Sphingobacterium sp. KACC 22765]
MMRKCLYITIFQALLLVGLSFGQNLPITEIRKDFKIGHKDEEKCKRHLTALNKHADSPVERGYEAAYYMFMAKHSGNPLKKMSYFKDGKKMLDKEIAANPNNVELRYIRLLIQYYTPSYLGYRGNIEEDKDFLMNNLYKINDKEAKQIIYTYLKGAKMYSDQELALLGR